MPWNRLPESQHTLRKSSPGYGFSRCSFFGNAFYLLIGFDLHPSAAGLHAQHLRHAGSLSAVGIKISVIFIYRVKPKLCEKIYCIFYGKLVQNFLPEARIVASVSVSLLLEIGEIAFSVSGGADFFAWLFILLPEWLRLRRFPPLQ